jgi:hypothetical protein
MIVYFEQIVTPALEGSLSHLKDGMHGHGHPAPVIQWYLIQHPGPGSKNM